jgi:DNA-directed RNA polymerase subunit M/transcription elongation factor TFIIS
MRSRVETTVMDVPTLESMRERGRTCFQKCLSNPVNIELLEAYVASGVTDAEVYRARLYETLGSLFYEWDQSSESPVQTTLERVYRNQLEWDHPKWDPVRVQIQEENAFQEHPPDLEEGVLECGRCHSKRTYSFQRQTRSADEGATTYSQCALCGHRWRHNN